MKAYLISDNIDTQIGMRLAGIMGTVVHEAEEVVRELESALNNKDIGIILVTEKIASLARDEVNRIKLTVDVPLIVEIPDRHGSVMERDRITRYIKEAIGVKI